MASVLWALPLVLVIVTVIYRVFRNLGRIWLDRSVRLALLEKVERRPDMVDSFQEILETLGGVRPNAPRPMRQDYTVTGVILAGMGVACMVSGRGLRVGQLAVGLYVGGIACVILGVFLAFAGVAIRHLAKSPTLPRKRP